MQWPDFTSVRTLDDLGKGIGAMLAQIRRRFRVETTGPLHHDGGEIRIVPSATMTAQLTSHISGGRYNYAEVQAESGGAWSVVSGGRTGDDAFEANGNTAISGKIVTLRFTENSDWRFAWDSTCDCGTTNPCAFVGTVSVKSPCGTPLAGYDVELTGEFSGTATTDSSGVAYFDVDDPPVDCCVDVTVEVTPPAGSNASSYSGSHQLCNSSPNVNIQISPATGFSQTTCGSAFVSETLYYTDEYGSCTLTFDSPGSFCSGTWTGSYTFSASSTRINSGGGCPVTPSTIPVNIIVTIRDLASSFSDGVKARRAFPYGTVLRSLSGSSTTTGFCLEGGDKPANTPDGETSPTCSFGSFSASVSIPPYVWNTSFPLSDVSETSATAIITD